MKKNIILFAILLVVGTMQSCKKKDLTHGFGATRAISINNTTLNITVGDTATLSIVYNSRQTAKENEQTAFSWSLQGPAIVGVQTKADHSVSLEALAEGTTQLKVASADGKLSAICDIVITKANTLEDTIYIDFGNMISEAPWNNLQNHSSGAVFGLLDVQGTNSGINIEVTDAFNDQNTSGEGTNTLGFPNTVSIDAFWGDNGNPTAALKVSNLNKRQKHTFTFYASRGGVGDNRETAYVVKGATEATVYLDASSNKGNVVTTEAIQPDTDGVITVTIKAGPNNNNGSKFYYLNALIIAPVN